MTFNCARRQLAQYFRFTRIPNSLFYATIDSYFIEIHQQIRSKSLDITPPLAFNEIITSNCTLLKSQVSASVSKMPHRHEVGIG